MFRGVDYYNIDGLLTEDEKMTRNLVKDFCEKEIKPLIVTAFHEEKPLQMRELAPRMGKLGMIGAFIPQEYGCMGTNYITAGLICQETGKIDSAVRGYIGVQSCLVMFPIWQYGSEEQKRRLLPPMAMGEKIGCFGLTEPNQGSDAGAMETSARKEGNNWIINGTKQWISDAGTADFALVWARTDEGVKGFLVERGTEGFTQMLQTRKGAMRAGDVGELSFNNCIVPDESVLPKARSLKAALSCLDMARYAIAWGSIGAAMDCYITALDYAKERKQFGSPIASYQLIQEKLVRMLMEITKGQLLAYQLGRLMDAGTATNQQISMAKKNNIAVARMCARVAREILGANGISLDYSPIRHMMNIEAVYTYQGTDDIHTLIIGKDITGIPAFRRNM